MQSNVQGNRATKQLEAAWAEAIVTQRPESGVAQRTISIAVNLVCRPAAGQCRDFTPNPQHLVRSPKDDWSELHYFCAPRRRHHHPQASMALPCRSKMALFFRSVSPFTNL